MTLGALLIALVLAGAEPPAERPLVNVQVIQADIVAGLAIGAGTNAQTGALGSLSVVLGGEHPALGIWDLKGPMSNADGRCALGAATLFGGAAGGGGGSLPTALAVLRAGEEAFCWTLVDTSQARPFPTAWLDWVRDEKPILANTLEADAYAQTVAMAHWTDSKAFEQAARHDLSYLQLFRQPEKYRGQIVRINGRMKRVRKDEIADPRAEPGRTVDAAMDKARQAGVRYLYEGWLFNDDFGPNPVCCVFSELPEGLPVAERMEVSVGFAGYFFKRYRYKAGDTPGANQFRDAPLLVGKVVQVSAKAAAEEDEAWGKPLLPLFLSLLGGSVAFVVFLTLWFRRDDSRVRRRLATVAPATFESPPEAEPRPLASPEPFFDE